MSAPFIGEIRMFGGNFAPVGWAHCNGQLVPISENDALFNLIGTTFGGDGQETFALPDLQSRVPIHQGGGHVLGESGGVESVTLSQAQLPSHTHAFVASTASGTGVNPGGALIASSVGAFQPYIEDAPAVAMNAAAVSAAGGNQPHDNLQSYTCINFIISLFGIFPTQN